MFRDFQPNMSTFAKFFAAQGMGMATKGSTADTCPVRNNVAGETYCDGIEVFATLQEKNESAELNT